MSSTTDHAPHWARTIVAYELATRLTKTSHNPDVQAHYDAMVEQAEAALAWIDQHLPFPLNFAPGDRVVYTTTGLQLRAVVVGDDEGWIKIKFSDDSTAVVRPSRLERLP